MEFVYPVQAYTYNCILPQMHITCQSDSVNYSLFPFKMEFFVQFDNKNIPSFSVRISISGENHESFWRIKGEVLQRFLKNGKMKIR